MEFQAPYGLLINGILVVNTMIPMIPEMFAIYVSVGDACDLGSDAT